MQATIRDLDEAGRIIANTGAAGGNASRIYGVSYDIEDRQKLLKEARDLAFTDAEAKAERYAQLAGRRLGDVRQVSEGNVQYGYDDGGYGISAAGVRPGSVAESGPPPLAIPAAGITLGRCPDTTTTAASATRHSS